MSSVRIIAFLLALACGHALADSPPPWAVPVAGLKTYSIEGSSSQQVSYDPTVSKFLNEPLDIEFNHQGIAGIEMTRVLLTKVDRTRDNRYYIDFDPGASDDPVFAIVPENGHTVIGAIKADHLILPGNGFIYALARTNKQFLERRKFLIRDEKVIEVKQPFLYVGVESKATRGFDLSSTQSSGETVTHVKKGEKVFVVLNDGDHYLVRTSIGLLGWIKIEPGKREGDVIERIFFAGD